jgi:hypothetical protein
VPKIRTNTSLLFHHHKYPSVTVPADTKAEVPAWVLRTSTFGAHAKAGNVTVDEPAGTEAPSAPSAPRTQKGGQRLKPASPPEE